jgi:hypothetical protein
VILAAAADAQKRISGVRLSSLLVFELRPDATRDALARVRAWARHHERAILLPLFTGVGAYFVVKGAVILLG